MEIQDTNQLAKRLEMVSLAQEPYALSQTHYLKIFTLQVDDETSNCAYLSLHFKSIAQAESNMGDRYCTQLEVDNSS